MLKTELHIHTSEDIIDKNEVEFSAKELIDLYHKKEYKVIAITNHEKSTYTKQIANYAKRKGILIIPAVEKVIEDAEILLYNFSDKELKNIKKISELKQLKSKKNLIIAPHPFYPIKYCLKEKLEQNIDIFDAIEVHSKYSLFLDFNKEAIKTAKKYNKTLVATTDSHKKSDMTNCYTLIDSKQNITEIFKAIKENRVIRVTKPLKLIIFLKNSFKLAFKSFFGKKSRNSKFKKIKKTKATN